MTRRHLLITTTAILISVVAILIGWTIGRSRRATEPVQQVNAPRMPIIEGEAKLAELYFPGPGGSLFPEEREVAVLEDPLEQLGQILEALLSGPVSEDLYPALPPEVTLEWLHLNPEGVLYVDLNFAGEAPLPAWGSRQEILAAYSIVNTTLANAPQIKSVVLLRNGQQRSTFAGHLDTSRPLLANQQLIATR